MIVRNPTWNSLTPPLPKFVSCDTVETNFLKEKLGEDGVFFIAQFDLKSTSAFLFQRKSDQKKFFIKKVSAEHKRQYQQSEHLAQFIACPDYIVNIAINCVSNEEENSLYYIYPYIHGKRLFAEPEEIISLATALAKLHLKKKSYPDQQLIIKNTTERTSQLNFIRKALANGCYSYIPYFSFVKKMAQQYDFDWINQEDAQPIHGDLNAGNLLLSENNMICFFDFEDALHSFHPVVLDLLFVIERIIFNQNSSTERLLNLGLMFIHAYKKAGGTYRYKTRDEFGLTILALKAFCLLTLLAEKNKNILNSEWDKFFKLTQKAENERDLIKTILQG